MSMDEATRIISYCIVIAAAPYVGVQIWNSQAMPTRIRRAAAVFMFLQALIYALLMASIIVRKIHVDGAWILWASTLAILMQAIVVSVLALRVALRRIAKSIVIVWTLWLIR